MLSPLIPMTPAMYSWPWHRITAFADVGITVPAMLVLCGWLLAARSWRGALYWLACFWGGLGLVVISKIAFMGWGLGVFAWDFTGYSGHAMRAAALAPVALYLLPWHWLGRWSQAGRILGVLLGLSLGLLIAHSRIIVGAHSYSESLLGLLLGSACGLLVVAWLARQTPAVRVPPWLIALSFCALFFVPQHGAAPTQSWLYGVAMQLSGKDRPFLRECWCFPEEAWITPQDPDGWRKRR